ncbi:MAG TPA: site-specific integrase [Dermatophilaceae bacterium]
MARGRALKRSNGEGSVFRRSSDGRWVARVKKVDEGGRLRSRERSAPSERVAHELLATLKADMAGGALPQGRTPTLGAWLTYWLTTSAKGRVAENTYDAYASITTHHLVPLLGRRKLDTTLRAHHLEAAYAVMAAGRPCGRADCPGAKGGHCGTCRPPLAPSSVLKAHRILCRALRVAARDYTTLNPDVVDAPPVRRQRGDSYTLEEVTKIVGAAASRRSGVRWLIGLLTGMRQGEVLALVWDDVDLDAGVITVKARAHRAKGGGMVRRPVKSDDSIRDIAAPPELVAALREHRKAQLGERLVAGPAWTPGGWVFTGRTGLPVRPEQDLADWHALTAAAGVRTVVQHAGTRHTVATLLLEANIHPRVVMELMGHSQISVTLNTYSHVRAGIVRAAVDGLAASVFAPPTHTHDATHGRGQ